LIKASLQEYILRSWSLVKIGTTANQRKLFFNLRKAKSKISALEEGDLHPDHLKLLAKRLGVAERDVVDMNRRLGGDGSLNTPIGNEDQSGEWQDWLVDDTPSQERILLESEELGNRRKALGQALEVLSNRERRIFEARRLADAPVTLEDLGEEFGVSRERVRQIEVRAFAKVQNAVLHRVAASEQPADRAPRTISSFDPEPRFCEMKREFREQSDHPAAHGLRCSAVGPSIQGYSSPYRPPISKIENILKEGDCHPCCAPNENNKRSGRRDKLGTGYEPRTCRE
jgi:RNA polymerase sigma factor (sigma-70 family)